MIIYKQEDYEFVKEKDVLEREKQLKDIETIKK